MKIFCAICREYFTGSSGSSIISTICGHVYHEICLKQWLRSNETCPHCRRKLVESEVFKLNLLLEQELSMEEVRLDSLQFQLTLKTIEIQDIKNTSKDMVSQNKHLKDYVKILEAERRGHTSVVSGLKDQILVLKTDLKKRTEELLRRQSSDQLGYISSHASDLIDLIDDSDSELQEDMMAQLTMPLNESTLQETENSELLLADSNESTASLKEQLSLKDAMLSSALSRISYLEEILSLNNNFSS